MSRFRSFLITAATAVGALCVSAWMAMLMWAEALPGYTEAFIGTIVLFLIGLGFGYLLVVIFLRR